MKTFKVRFYQAHTEENEKEVTAANVLLCLASKQENGELLPQVGEGKQKHEIRELKATKNQKFVRGVLALVRDDAPHIREEDGSERIIELKEEEGVLEKNYFLFYPETRLLVWQVNGSASHVSRLGRYLTEVSGVKIKFLDILQKRAYERLQQGVVNAMQFRVARMQNADNIDENDWEAGAFELMSGVGGTAIKVEVSTPRISRGLDASALKKIVKRLMGRNDIKTLKVSLDGEKEPIDLLADRISDSIKVNMAGRYPIPEDVVNKLAEARDRQRDALEDILGVGDKILE